MVVGFISMLVVIPYLTSNPELFGIYSVCLSISLYLSYADTGFLSAGQKFAAEEYAKNNLNEEISITGFLIFILIFMLLPFSIFSVYLASNPETLLGSFSFENRDVARNLLLFVGLLLPIQTILQRLTSSRRWLVAHTANMLLPTNWARQKGTRDTAAGPVKKPTVRLLGPY